MNYEKVAPSIITMNEIDDPLNELNERDNLVVQSYAAPYSWNMNHNEPDIETLLPETCA